MTENHDVSLWEYSLLRFRERIAAATPTPGGGAVAAVSATLAAALLQMICGISAKRNPRQQMDAMAGKVKILEEQLAICAEEDILAFDRYLAARKVRTESSAPDAQRCLLQCTEIPLAAAEAVAKLELCATEMIPATPATLASELATAQYLLGASRKALLASVKANLRELGEGKAPGEMARRMMALQGKAD